jgi:RimJ/RimL family protein N-acetyltransferase
MFVEHSPVLWEIHVNFLAPCWWAMKAQPAFVAAIQWAWDNSGCQRIVAAVADSPHRTNLKLPATVGMARYGRNPKCIQRNGQLLDQYLFGISRPPQ